MTSDIVTLGGVQAGRVAGGSATGQMQGKARREEAASGGAAASAPVMAKAELERAVESLNESVQSHRRSLRFSVDEDSGRTVIRVVDPSTDEVIRQIPPEEVLDVARHLGNSAGALLRAKV
jgi:flagellar protein FlaG